MDTAGAYARILFVNFSSAFNTISLLCSRTGFHSWACQTPSAGGSQTSCLIGGRVWSWRNVSLTPGPSARGSPSGCVLSSALLLLHKQLQLQSPDRQAPELQGRHHHHRTPLGWRWVCLQVGDLPPGTTTWSSTPSKQWRWLWTSGRAMSRPLYQPGSGRSSTSQSRWWWTSILPSLSPSSAPPSPLLLLPRTGKTAAHHSLHWEGDRLQPALSPGHWGVQVRVLADPSHPGHGLLEPLPSGRRLRKISHSFFPDCCSSSIRPGTLQLNYLWLWHSDTLTSRGNNGLTVHIAQSLPWCL